MSGHCEALPQGQDGSGPHTPIGRALSWCWASSPRPSTSTEEARLGRGAGESPGLLCAAHWGPWLGIGARPGLLSSLPHARGQLSASPLTQGLGLCPWTQPPAGAPLQLNKARAGVMGSRGLMGAPSGHGVRAHPRISAPKHWNRPGLLRVWSRSPFDRE